MTDLKKTAQQLAAKGRYGDTMLLHVNPLEVAGLASLLPHGRLPVNPATGLPEAFFFLPFLASLFGAAAPAAAAATVAAPAAAAAGSALATGAAAAGAAAPAMTAGTLMGGASAGSLAGTMGALGGAAKSVASGIGSLFGGGAGAAGSGLGQAAAAAGKAGMSGMSAAPAASIATPQALALPTQTLTHGFTSGGGFPGMSPGSLGRIAQGAGIDNLTTASIGGAGANTPAATAAAAPKSPLLGGPITPENTIDLTAHGPITPENTIDMTAHGPITPENTIDMTAHGPIVEGPWGADPNAATPGKGGIGKLLSTDNLMKMALVSQLAGGLFQKKEKGEDKGPSRKQVDAMRYSGGDPVFPGSDYVPGTSGEWDYFPNANNGGLVSLAGGGLVPGYAEGGPVDPQAQMPQDMTFPQNGIGSLVSPEQIPESPFPSRQIGSEPEPGPENEIAAPTNNDRELIAQTVEAIQGKIPNPEQIMLAFVKEFGEGALQDLMMRIKGLPGQQQSDGQSDSIPAMIDGKQPAALSEGEYVIPADAVSGLGNGSTQAGAQQLDSLVGGVRQQRTGSPQQPPMLNSGGLISSYANGGIVGLADGGKVRQFPQEEYMPLPDEEFIEPGPYGGDQYSYIVAPGTEPRSSRLSMMYQDPNLPLHVRPETGQTQEWVDNMKHYQEALRYVSRHNRGAPTREGKK